MGCSGLSRQLTWFRGMLQSKQSMAMLGKCQFFCRIELIKYIFVYGWNKSNTVLFIEYKIYLGIVGRFHVQVFNQAVNYFLFI